MAQEEKSLLLIDLCSRLPYGVKVWYKYETWKSKKFATSIRLPEEKIVLSSKFNKEGDWHPIEEAGEILVKPYLRPMSSMTEEEVEEYRNIDNRSYSCPMDYAHIPASERIDWLLKNHFDFRGLIPKGLAIEVTKENNPYED